LQRARAKKNIFFFAGIKPLIGGYKTDGSSLQLLGYFEVTWNPPPFCYFWYLWLTTQIRANRQVRNQFCLLTVFISFPLARCAPPPHPAPFFGGEGKYQKSQKKKIVGVGELAVAFCFAEGFVLLDGS
jgi:hypothetical protein